MKTELESQDIEAITLKVVELLKPLIAGNNKDDVLFDVKGLAEYLQVSETWIYERTHFKEIPYTKLKGHLRFKKRDIDKWLNSLSIPAVSTYEKALKVVRR